MTLQEIANEMGCSAAYVSEIQGKAVAKLRRIVKRHDITYEELLICLKFYF